MRAVAPTTRWPGRAFAWTRCLLLAALVGGCSGTADQIVAPIFERPATTVSYDVVLEGALSDAVTDLAVQSLASYRLRGEGAPSLAFLRRRAESDVPLLLKILRSRGYYSASAEAAVEEAGPGAARVVITAAPGPAYTLIQHRLLIAQTGGVAPPALDAQALGSPVGKPARAATIAVAEGAAVVALNGSGFPYARFTGRQGLADPDAATLQVDSAIDAGPAASFGEVAFTGIETIDEAYLLSYLPWTPGDSFDTAKLREYQRLLVATGLFRALTVSLPETPPPPTDPESGPQAVRLPVLVTAEEAPRRSVTAGLRYDTDLGPTVRATFEHRNLFGANERLLAETEVGLVEQHLGLGLRKPQFRRPGQDLLADLTLARENDDAFDSLGLTGFAGIERQLSARWRAGLGVLGEVSRIDDGGDKGTAVLFGVPVVATHDGANDLLNPTDGVRLRLAATPFAGVFDGSGTQFLTLDASGAIYRPLDDKANFVIAGRGRVASILSPDLGSIPATRRLYSGGGGSVRGYAENFIGPLDADNDPIGGRSALEAGVEFRARLFGDIGGVVFAEAGSVSTAMYPDFDDGVQATAGLGVRYYSLAGPIRIDLAFPVNGRPADDAFQVYFSIGQAF